MALGALWSLLVKGPHGGRALPQGQPWAQSISVHLQTICFLQTPCSQGKTSFFK